jgi:anti-sigma factor (TIGR02949 family)
MNDPTSTRRAPASSGQGQAGNMGDMRAMLNCTAAEQRLHRFLDHELTEDDAAEVQLHLEQCENCRSRFRFEAGLRRLVRQGGQWEGAPVGLGERILHLLGRRATS